MNAGTKGGVIIIEGGTSAANPTVLGGQQPVSNVEHVNGRELIVDSGDDAEGIVD